MNFDPSICCLFSPRFLGKEAVDFMFIIRGAFLQSVAHLRGLTYKPSSAPAFPLVQAFIEQFSSRSSQDQVGSWVGKTTFKVVVHLRRGPVRRLKIFVQGQEISLHVFGLFSDLSAVYSRSSSFFTEKQDVDLVWLPFLAALPSFSSQPCSST